MTLREPQEGALPPAKVTGVPQRGQMLVKWHPTATRFQQAEQEGSRAAGGIAQGKDRTLLWRGESLLPKVWSVGLMTARNEAEGLGT